RIEIMMEKDIDYGYDHYGDVAVDLLCPCDDVRVLSESFWHDLLLGNENKPDSWIIETETVDCEALLDWEDVLRYTQDLYAHGIGILVNKITLSDESKVYEVTVFYGK